MLNVIVTVLFLVSVAFAAGSITLVSQFRNRYKTDLFRTLLYMQVFYFMFGFYDIWGQVIIFSYLSPLFEAAVLDYINEISVLLGSPFIVFGWLMFLRFMLALADVKIGKLFNSLFLVVNIVFLVLLGFLNYKTRNLHTLEAFKYFFLASNLVYVLFSAITLLSRNNRLLFLSVRQKTDFVIGLIGFVILQSTSLLFYEQSLYVLLTFIFLFFAGTAFIPVYIKFMLNVQALAKPTSITDTNTFENFCKKFEISPREKDIIREICNGLTNQQIADKLFISLQTVKDHTHRIYGKTMATSRMQLMKMVQEITRT